ncbi:MAG: NAD(P)/FAD-dependent oxidoreductase [Treponema sp.]|jgi:NADH dehydrogenase|nr:NAD(P)/FAD-dependent oxidoreductase [Treponema sp.]
MAGKHILIIGGGYAGIAAAKKLAKQFKKRDDITITLVDKHPFHTLMTELHEVAGRRVEPDSVRIPYSKIFGASKVTVKLDAITSVDFTKKQAASETAVYPYDYLVLGAGAEPEFFGIPGIKENSFTLWSYDDAMKLRYHLEEVFEKAVAEPDAEKQKKMLTFVVAGAGFTGIEMAGELLEWRDEMCNKWLTGADKVRIVIVEAMPAILPIFEKDLADKVAAYLKKHNVELMTGAAITGAEPGVVKLKTGATLETATFIWTAGVTGNSFAGSLGLSAGPYGKNPPDPAKKNRQGRLLVTGEMRSVDYPDVFPVGDNLWFIENEKPLPQIVETALQTGATAAENIIADIEGTRGAKQFKSDYHGFMVSVGGKYAVSNAMGIKMSGIFAQAMKHFVNLHYLIGVAGVNQCWEYIKHEFLDIKTHRSFVRGFGSYKMRGYWVLPLRLWVGLMWVFEGVNKIGEGWLAWSSGSKSTWMFSPWVIQAGSAAAQAVSAASGTGDAATAASGAAETVSAASGAVSGAAGTAVSAAASQFKAVWDLTMPIFDAQGAVATWFRTTFMDSIMSHIPFQGFQLMVVLVEIGIGLCMLGGLFTWLAGAVSIAMCLVFTLSGMFEWYKVWFIFTGFLLLGGAGRAFGLDCWAIPFFKRWWNGTAIARKFYLYFDGNSK